MKGRVHSVQTMGTLDGPGVRVVVFFQGCPLRCAYCHNPDTWHIDGGVSYDVDSLFKKIQRYCGYFGEKGGVTFSGGEPLLQAGFLYELLLKCRGHKIHTALDTSGIYLNDLVHDCLALTDLVLLDIKHWDEQQHEKLTGGSLSKVLSFLAYLSEVNKPYWVRHVVVKGLNDTKADIEKLLGLLKPHHKPEKIELLPFHTLGSEKYADLGLKCGFSEQNVPDEQTITSLQHLLPKTK